jgi:translation initiation factor IF-2
MAKTNKKTKPAAALSRPPVVTIMGHVDHGKTTLLDKIRETRVAQSEHGGITQHIGAYQAYIGDQAITFIDTPGHAAFSKMRARGAQVTDIVVLVVAANDGVKPQTVESINHIKAAKVPFIVAINKMDVDGASPEKVKGDLAEQEVFCEGFGGQVPAVEVSGKTGQGLDQLLAMIVLVAQVEELTADPQGETEAVIIESNLDKHQGAIATVIVKNGTLKPGQTVYEQTTPVRIRSLLDQYGKTRDHVAPGEPCVILGFKNVPPVGATLKDHSFTPEPPAPPKEPDGGEGLAAAVDAVESAVDTTPEEEAEVKPHFNLLLKADTAGTLEAIKNSIGQEEITLVDSGVGSITESDIMLALDTKAVIIGFAVKVSSEAKKLADTEGVRIKTFAIIYELLDYLEHKVLELIEPTIFESELGQAKLLQVFDIRGIQIAGCKVESGKLTKGDRVHIVRRDRQLKNSKIASLKQGKSDIKSAGAGEECGVVLDPLFDFRMGDVLKSYRLNK